MLMLLGIPGFVGFYYYIVGKFGEFTSFEHLANKSLIDQSKGLRVNIGTSRDDNLLEIASSHYITLINLFVGHFL